MLLLVALTLKGRIIVSEPTPVSIPPFGGSKNKVNYPNTYDEAERRQREQRIRIEIEDSEIIAIVELTLRNFII